MLFAVHGAEGVAAALLAYRFAAGAAICRGRHFWMILAVHFSSLNVLLQCDAPEGFEAGAPPGLYCLDRQLPVVRLSARKTCAGLLVFRPAAANPAAAFGSGKRLSDSRNTSRCAPRRGARGRPATAQTSLRPQIRGLQLPHRARSAPASRTRESSSPFPSRTAAAESGCSSLLRQPARRALRLASCLVHGASNRMRGDQLRRRLHIGGALHERHRGGGIPRQFGAGRAGFQMTLHARPCGPP